MESIKENKQSEEQAKAQFDGIAEMVENLLNADDNTRDDAEQRINENAFWKFHINRWAGRYFINLRKVLLVRRIAENFKHRPYTYYGPCSWVFCSLIIK